MNCFYLNTFYSFLTILYFYTITSFDFHYHHHYYDYCHYYCYYYYFYIVITIIISWFLMLLTFIVLFFYNFKTYDVAKHCSKLAIMTLRLYESCSFGVFDGNFEQCLFDLFFWRSSFEALLYFAHSQLVLLFFKYFLI